MKRRISVQVLVICFFVMQFLGIQAEAQESRDEPEQLYARSAVLMDADSGRVLFGKEEDIVRPMASTTKIMTCILALENMEEGQIVSASDYAASQPKVRLGVKGKEEYYLKDLLYSLMLESHNDSAVVIAEGIAGSVEDFADLMNQKAKELGCGDTYFVTPNGLDGYDEEGTHGTTARDLARIMKYCITESDKAEEFLEITRTKTYQFQNAAGDRTFSCNNHNAFLDMMEGALTGKTGFTADAGYCYVGALRRDGKTLIVALLACGWPNNKGYKWEDTRKLMEYGLANYEYRMLYQEREPLWIEVKGGVDPENIFEKRGRLAVRVKGEDKERKVLLGKDERIDVKIRQTKRIGAPVKKGQKVGMMEYRIGKEKIASYRLIADGEAEKRSLNRCFGEILKRICI